MIISFLHQFIYIRTRKTASSTIEEVLRRSLAPGDVYVRNNALRTVRSRIAAAPSLAHSASVYTHMKAAEIAMIVPRRVWRRFYKFTSERHPYEKAVSLAWFNFGVRRAKDREHGKAVKREFSDFLGKAVRSGDFPSFEYYTIDGKVVVDDFVRHETLERDLQRICGRLDIHFPLELPRRKTEFRDDRRPAREMLSEEQRRIVFDRCRPEFELLGYEP